MCSSEEVACIHASVAQELERRSVELVGSRLGDDVDDGSSGVAVFGVVVACLNTELLDGVRVGEDRVVAPDDIRVSAAIELVAHLAPSRSIRRDRQRLLGIGVARSAGPRPVDNARNKVNHRGNIAAIEWKVFHCPRIDDLAQSARFRCCHGGLGGHGDHLYNLANRKLHVEAVCGIDV